jgi:arginase
MIAVPYHLDQYGVGVGRGPLRILEALGQPAHVVDLEASPPDGILPRVGVLNSRLAHAIGRRTPRSARDPLVAHPHPLILAGSCNNALGALAGLAHLGVTRPGVVWFDAHADFNTPETSISGALDGMALAAAIGDCHDDLCAKCGLAKSVPADNVVLAASRDLDPLEAVRLRASRIACVSLEDLVSALDCLATRADAAYLHIDIDVLDPAVSPGVNCTTPGGLTPAQLFDSVGAVAARMPIAAAAIANYNPARDPEDRTLAIVLQLVAVLKDVLKDALNDALNEAPLT